MITKILFLYSLINIGDVGHSTQLMDQLKQRQPSIILNSIDANLPSEQLCKAYQQEQEPTLICAIGEKGLDALTKLVNSTIQLPPLAASMHQYCDNIPHIPLSFLAVPEASLSKKLLKSLKKSIPHLSLTFAVPTKNPTIAALKESYDTWKHPQKPTQNSNNLIVILPGDAPDVDGTVRHFTKTDAKKLFKRLYAFWKKEGCHHHVVIHNGPRTGKYHPHTDTIACSHEFMTGTNPDVAVDTISRYFVELCKKHDLPHTFFNFAWEINGQERKNNSVFNQLLYLAQQPDSTNYFVLPGESVSMLGQIPLYLPASRIIVFKPSSMNKSHKKIFNLGLKRNYYRYFTSLGVSNKTQSTLLRTHDDAAQIVHDLYQAYGVEHTP